MLDVALRVMEVLNWRRVWDRRRKDMAAKISNGYRKKYRTTRCGGKIEWTCEAKIICTCHLGNWIGKVDEITTAKFQTESLQATFQRGLAYGLRVDIAGEA